MKNSLAALQLHKLCLIKDAISQKLRLKKPPEKLSNYLFRIEMKDGDKSVIFSYLTIIKSQLEKVLDPANKYFKYEGLFLEY